MTLSSQWPELFFRQSTLIYAGQLARYRSSRRGGWMRRRRSRGGNSSRRPSQILPDGGQDRIGFRGRAAAWPAQQVHPRLVAILQTIFCCN